MRKEAVRAAALREILTGTRGRYRMLCALAAAHEVDIKHHRRALLRYCRLASHVSYKNRFLLRIAALALSGGALLVPVGVVAFLLPDIFKADFVIPIAAGLGVVLASLLFCVLWFGEGHRRLQAVALGMLAAAAALAAPVGLLVIRQSTDAWPDPNALSEAAVRTQFGFALLVVTVIALLSVATSLLAAGLLSRVRAWCWIHRWPAEMVFGDLTVALQALRRPARPGSGHLRSMRLILTRLDRIALCFRFGFPLLLRTGGTGDQDIAQRYSEVARAFEGYKMWVAVPKDDTRDRLRGTLLQAVIAVASGAFDDLPTDDGALIGRRPLRAQALHAARTIITALLPLAALLIASRVGLSLTKAQESWFAVASVTWLVVVLLTTFDPLLTARVSTFRELVAALRGGPK